MRIGRGALASAMSMAEGSIVAGVVTGLAPFGAFVQLPDGATGLVHISEVANTYVRDIADHLHVGDSVTVKVLARDRSGKIALSIKQALADYKPRPQRSGGRSGPDSSFEDKLGRFLKESSERLSTLKRHNDSRRGGRGA